MARLGLAPVIITGIITAAGSAVAGGLQFGAAAFGASQATAQARIGARAATAAAQMQATTRIGLAREQRALLVQFAPVALGAIVLLGIVAVLRD